ncbi:MAG TPA: hypothetical protein VFC92_09800 [Bacteroidales bacterium]|nr:hypothetical protein [Bacteroidales bacterium]
MIPLGLWLKKLLYGKYSLAFQQHINNLDSRRNFKKNYTTACSKTDPLNHYHKVIESDAGLKVFQSIHPIVFNEVAFGLQFRKVAAKIGKYNCYDSQNYNGVVWRRLGTRERIYNHGVKRIYHFIDKKYFFGELFFSDLRKIDPAVIAGSLLKKYTGTKQSVTSENFRIEGENAFIFFENSGINLSIKYISTADVQINEKLIEVLRPITLPEYSARELTDEL